MRDHWGRRIDYNGHKTVSCDDGEHRRTKERIESPNWPVRTKESQFGVESISTDKGGKLTRPSEMKPVERVTLHRPFPQAGRRGMLTWEENRNTCQIVILSGLRRDFDDATSVTRLRRRDFAISTKKLCFLGLRLRVITTSSDYDFEGLQQRNYVIETQNKHLKGSDEAVFTPQRRFSFVDGPPTARRLRLRIRSGTQRKLRFQLRRDAKIRNKVDYFPMGAVWRINLFAFFTA